MTSWVRGCAAGLALSWATVAAAESPELVLAEVDQLVSDGAWRSARDVLEAARVDGVRTRDLDLTLARLRSWAGDRAGTLAILDEVRGNEFDADLDVWRGRTLAQLGRYEAARRTVEPVVNAHPEYVDAWAVITDSFLWDNNVGGARTVLARALDAVPDDPVLLARLARVEYFDGNVHIARQRQRAALVADPDLADGPRTLALYSEFVTEVGHRVDVISDRDPWNTSNASVRWRPRHPWQLGVGVERAIRYGRTESLGWGEVTTRLSRGISGSVRFSGSPRGGSLPDAGSALAFSFHPSHLWTGTLRLRALRYVSGVATAGDLGVGATRGRWEFGYKLSLIHDTESKIDHAHTVSLAHTPTRWARLGFDLYRGADGERLDANTVVLTRESIGVVLHARVFVAPGWALRGEFGTEQRRGDYLRRAFGAGLIRHF